jgi:hypothetical protein
LAPTPVSYRFNSTATFDNWGYGFSLQSRGSLECWLNRTFTARPHGGEIVWAMGHYVNDTLALLQWQGSYGAVHVEGAGADTGAFQLPVVSGFTGFGWDEKIQVKADWAFQNLGFRYLYNRIEGLELSIECADATLTLEEGAATVWGLDAALGGPSARVHGLASHVDGETPPFVLAGPGFSYGVSHNGTGEAILQGPGESLTWTMPDQDLFLHELAAGEHSLRLVRDGQGDGSTSPFDNADVFWMGIASFARVDSLSGPV